MAEKSDSMPWMAVALFVGTALASQTLQHFLNKKRDERNDDDKKTRKPYRERWKEQRLSYENLRDFRPKSSFLPGAGMGGNRLSFAPRISDALGPPNEDDNVYDFQPKNSNWCHFEQWNEDDAKEGLAQPAIEQTNQEDDGSCSTSSGEDFLWTNGAKTQCRESRRKSEKIRRMSTPRQGTFTTRNSSAAESEDMDDDFVVNDYAGNEADVTQRRSNRRRRSSTLGTLVSVDSMEKIIAGITSGTSENSNSRHARAKYNASIMPNKVVMVRHGQSQGNINEVLYSTTPDNAMKITKLGWTQARKAGEVLRSRIIADGEPVHFIVSPYARTVETFHGIVSAWCDPAEFAHIKDRDKRIRAWYSRLLEMGLTWHEDPRIREQDFGNYQNPEKIKQYKQERHRFGPFFYRFPHGESASDVFDRVSTFLDSLWRSFDLNRSRNYVLITHGISIRVLLARYFRYSIDQFSLLANPKNCEMIILGHDGAGKLALEGRCELEVNEDKETGEKEVTGYEFHDRLRVLPKRFVHKLNIRISHDDTIPEDDKATTEKSK